MTVLLKHLHDFARSRKIDPAFWPKAIRWIIPLDGEGRLMGPGLIETQGEGKRGRMISAPRTSRAKDSGQVAEFLADGLTAVFGLEKDPEKPLKESERRKHVRKHQDFWAQVRASSEQTRLPALQAVLGFHERLRGSPPFLRYGIESGSTAGGGPAWWVMTARGAEERLGEDLFTFQVDGVILLLEETVIRPWWRGAFAAEIREKEKEASRGICLVTGEPDVPIAKTHLPKITGVRGAQATGAAIVSFDKSSFASYGFEQSLNAPVSVAAVSAYCDGLNTLLASEDHCLDVGQTLLCFWARESEEPSNFVARMLRRPDPLAVKDFLRSPWAGIDRASAGLEDFYSVTLSGNGGRVVVRRWMQTTVENARESLRGWFRDLEIAQMPAGDGARKKKARSGKAAGIEETPPLALFRLACATVREAKDLRPGVTEQLYRAALERAAPSVALIKPILSRLEADLQKYGSRTLQSTSRFALLRLVLNRNRREGEAMIQPEVFQTEDVAYNCGRLLAVLAEAQAKAHEYRLKGPGVAERYFGTASVSPFSVFPILLRLNRHHLGKIRKSPKYSSHAYFLEAEIQSLLAKFRPADEGLPPSFPRLLDLQGQGRFAIGFYQQKAYTENRRAEKREVGGTAEEPSQS